jgi:nitroreductase
VKTFLELAEARRSVRAYKPDPVPEDLLLQVLECARRAPSACNRQPWRFVVVRDEARRRLLGTAYSRDWFWSAPAIVAVCVVPADAWTRPHDGKNYAWVDGAIAMDHLTLAAADLGLGTCWIGAFDPEPVRHILNLPDGVEVVAMTPLGYPADDPAPRPRTRRPLSETLIREHFP